MTAPFPYSGLGSFSPKLRSYSVVRRQVSQGGTGELGVVVSGTDGPVDPTLISLRLYLSEEFEEPQYATEDEVQTYGITEPAGDLVAEFHQQDIKREEKGTYSVQIAPPITSKRGNLTGVWTYTVDGNELTYIDRLRITEPMPVYDSLRDFERYTVEQVSWMFGDLFDSTEGGPNLIENFQTHFNAERIAQLMSVAIMRINTIGPPTTSYGIGTGTKGLPGFLHGILTMATYVEVLRHFMRSYVEQPEYRNARQTYTDRRDYLQRWKTIYDDEKRELDEAIKMAKRRLLGLGGGSLLVAGGIYGRAGSHGHGLWSAAVRGHRFYAYIPGTLPAGF